MEWREVWESTERERGGRPCYNRTERECDMFFVRFQHGTNG